MNRFDPIELLRTRASQIRPRHLLVAAWCCVVFLATLSIYTRNNDFPIHYHPDEVGKLKQLSSEVDERNFNHPQLLLEGIEIALWAFDTPADRQSIAERGRWVSAVFASMATVLFGLFGYLATGWLGLIAASILVGLCPMLVVNAHYLKEDTCLIFGISLVLLVGQLCLRAPWPRRELAWCGALGLAGAVAASGKYVGLNMLGIALIVLCYAGFRRPPVARRFGVLVGTFLCFWLLINYRILSEHQYFFERFGKEFKHSITGHGSVALPVVNLYSATTATQESWWPILLLAGLYIPVLIRRREKAKPWDWLLPVCLLVWLVTLAFNKLPGHRYALPLVVLVHLMAGISFAWIVGAMSRVWRIRTIVGALGVIVLFSHHYALSTNYTEQFRNDSRQRLRVWLADSMTDGSAIVADGYAGLDTEGDPKRFPDQPELPQNIRTSFFLPKLGNLKELREAGVQYAVLCDIAYQRFFVQGIRHRRKAKRKFQVLRDTYREIMQEGELVWHSSPEPNMHAFTNPEIRVYRIQE